MNSDEFAHPTPSTQPNPQSQPQPDPPAHPAPDQDHPELSSEANDLPPSNQPTAQSLPSQQPSSNQSSTQTNNRDTRTTQNPKKHRLKLLWIALGVFAGAIVLAFAAYLIFLLVNFGNFYHFGQRFTIQDGEIYFLDRDGDIICEGENMRRTCGFFGDGSSVCHCESKYDANGNERPYTTAKPIIYLYPTAEIEITVKLGYPEKLTTDYPTYQNGWRVLASPSGNLTDLNSGRQLYSLYWEGQGNDYSQEISNGFVVKGENAAEFLEEKLAVLGLNFREREEFIIYWLPKLEQNPYNYIRFATASEIDSEMPIAVSPKPDTTIRVRMLFKGLESPQTIPEQPLTPAPARAGFTLVEWGGVDLDN